MSFFLSYNSCTMRLTIFKCTIQCFLVYSQSCTHHLYLIPEPLHHSKGNPIHSLAVIPHSFLPPPVPGNHNLIYHQDRHTSFYCASQITVVFFFTKSRVVTTLHQASLLDHFFQRSTYLVSLCHVLVILSILQTHSLLLYLIW